MNKILVDKSDLSWLASRSFIKNENVDKIWNFFQDSEQTFTIYEEDFHFLENEDYGNLSWRECISVVRNIVRDRCRNRLILGKYDIWLLQEKKLLLGEGTEEISNIWKELNDRCPMVDHSASKKKKWRICGRSKI